MALGGYTRGSCFSEGGESRTRRELPRCNGNENGQQALRESEEQFRASFEISTVGMAQADPITGQRLLRVNQRYCEMTGYSEAELLQLSIRDINHPEDRDADFERFQRLVHGEVSEYWAEKRENLRKTEGLFGLRQRPISCVTLPVNQLEPWRSLLTLRVASKPKRPCVKARLTRASFELAAVGQAHCESCHRQI